MDITSTDFAWLTDAVVGLLVLVSAYLAMVRGLTREVFALASWVIAFFAAFFFAPALHPMLAGLPVINSLECRGAMLVAFIVVFGAALIVTGVLIWLFSGSTRESAIGVVDQGLGFIYGALRGLVLVAVLYITYQQIVPDAAGYAFIESAYSISIVSDVADAIKNWLPSEFPSWFQERVDQLLGQCGDSGQL